MATLSTVVYSGATAAEEAKRPSLFTRTDYFSFSDPGGKLRIDSAVLGPKGLKFSVVGSTGHEVGVEEAKHISVLMPVRGALQVAVGDHQLRADTGSALSFGPNRRRTRVLPDDKGLYEALVLLVPPGSLAGPDPDERAPVADTRGSAILAGTELAALAGLMAFIRADLSSPVSVLTRAPAAHALEVLLIETLRGVLLRQRASEELRAKPAAMRAVLAAEAFMEANFARPLSVGDIAAAAGTSVRGLQLAYQAGRGMSPREALSLIRLAAARRMLTVADEDSSVTDVAFNCGFAHLSRFAVAYRARYGERPSETRQRALRA